jgi:hypothetical protein
MVLMFILCRVIKGIPFIYAGLPSGQKYPNEDAWINPHAALSTMSEPMIVLPSRFEGRTLSKVAADVVACSPNGIPARLTFDLSELTFVNPSGVVFFSNLIWWLHYRGTGVQFSGTGAYSAALRFLDDSLFFEQNIAEQSSVQLRRPDQPLGRLFESHSRAAMLGLRTTWSHGLREA